MIFSRGYFPASSFSWPRFSEFISGRFLSFCTPVPCLARQPPFFWNPGFSGALLCPSPPPPPWGHTFFHPGRGGTCLYIPLFVVGGWAWTQVPPPLRRLIPSDKAAGATKGLGVPDDAIRRADVTARALGGQCKWPIFKAFFLNLLFGNKKKTSSAPPQKLKVSLIRRI